MKKILAIIGSPRKFGNTYQVVERIKDSLFKMDSDIEFDYLFLRGCDIKMCTGCFTCVARGEDKCPLGDDIAAIKSSMMQADGILLAAPVYAMGVPGIMKNFIDRLAYTLHRPCFFDKAFLAITTVGGVRGTKQTLEQLAILSAGGRLAGKLGVSVPPIEMAGFDKRAAKGIKKASKAFYNALLKQQRKLPGVGDWAYFHSFKAFTTFRSYKDACPADAIYYKDKDEFFYPISGHYLRRFTGKLFKVLMRSVLGLMVKVK